MEKEKTKKEEMKPCPLCGAMLLYDKWLKVIGVYEEQQKHSKQLELELNKAKEQEKKLKEEHKKIKLQGKKLQEQYRSEKAKLKRESQQDLENFKKKLERQKQIELKKVAHKAQLEGIEKQKARTEKVAQMAEKARKDRDKAQERVKQLEEMIKKGTTPQIEGFNFEHELANQLKQRFPNDEIKPTGHKKGDVIQIVQVEAKKIGKIIYECKKTKEFENKFIEQIQRDKTRMFADYGVIVTWATKEKSQNFWVDSDIIIIHPYAVLDIAVFLRAILLQMYSLKLSKSELETKGKVILEFMQSEEFRTSIQKSITKSKEAYESLKKEITTHFNAWDKRAEIYKDIYRNANIIERTVQYILLHSKAPENLLDMEKLPPLQIPYREEQKERKEGLDIKDIPF